MDNRGARPPTPPEPRKGLLSGRYHDAGALDSPEAAGAPPTPLTPPSQPISARAPQPSAGGLLSRFGGQQAMEAPPAAPAAPVAPPAPDTGWRGLLARFGGQQAGAADPAQDTGWRGLAEGARNLGKNLARMTENALRRAPVHGDWRATDFAPEEMAEWDAYGDAPFALPQDPDAGDHYHPETDHFEAARRARESLEPAEGRDGRAVRGARRRRDDRDDWDEPAPQREERGRDAAWERQGGGLQDTDWGRARRRQRPGGRAGHEYSGRRGGRDDDWDARAERDERDERDEREREDDQNRPARQDDIAHWNLVGDLRGALDEGAIADSMNTLLQLGAASPSMSRVERVRLLARRRPVAAVMLALFLAGFLLGCLTPLVTLGRLGLDTADLVSRVNDLRALSAGGGASLINASDITRAQGDLASIEGDLYELNGAMSVAGAPVAAFSHSVRDDQLLLRIGYDLAGAASETLQIAQKLITPLEGGALSADSSSSGIQLADIQQARALLNDAYARTLDAIQVYHQLDQRALPAQLQPGTTYGDYLARLPLAVNIFTEMSDLLDAAPALLGVGQPASYLMIAMDRTELRPGGGFQGNYGLLEVDGGRQSSVHPFSLNDTYNLDKVYTKLAAPNPAPASCPYQVAMPTNLYWWWPYRCIKDFGWGLRDSNLSADFPTNARLAMQIVQEAGVTSNGAPIQGVVAFTPVVIENLLRATGDMPMPDYHVVVTPETLEYDIHHFQLAPGAGAGQDRKQFTHDLANALLDRLRSMHGAGLKVIFKIAADAIQSKDLEVYLADPRAELALRQLGVASTVATGATDGYFVVDANDGGNKANLYVTETQTDFVTLLPNGGAFHRLAIAVTYDKKGDIFNPVGQGNTPFDDYSDLQRTYLPGDAVIAGWSGFNPANFFQPPGCGSFATVISDCSPDHGIDGVSTASDTPGRTMVMGALLVMCGPYAQDTFRSATGATYSSSQETAACASAPQPHTQTIFISWYTSNAYTVDAGGHGTYTELVEKQSGDSPHLTVYVSRGALQGAEVIKDMATFNGLIGGAQKVYDHSLDQNQLITYHF